MNKKFFIAWLVLFIVWMAGDFLVHGVLLKSDYMQLSKLYRSDTESQAYFIWMLLAHVLMAGAFRMDLHAWQRSQTVGGAGRAIRDRSRAAGSAPRLSDLLRCAAANGGDGGQAGHLQRHLAYRARNHRCVVVSRHRKDLIASDWAYLGLGRVLG